MVFVAVGDWWWIDVLFSGIIGEIFAATKKNVSAVKYEFLEPNNKEMKNILFFLKFTRFIDFFDNTFIQVFKI